MSPVALVTGGQQGIGLGIAKALKSAGFRIAIASLPTADSQVVQDALTALGDGSAYFQPDVYNIDAVSALLDHIETHMGPVTTLVNKAGVGSPVRGQDYRGRRHLPDKGRPVCLDCRPRY